MVQNLGILRKEYCKATLTEVLSEDIIHGNILDCPEQDQRTWEFIIKEENYIDY